MASSQQQQQQKMGAWGKPRDTSQAQAPLQSVQIDGRAVLKIIRHCAAFTPTPVTGELLGLDIGSTLEITDCFPFPTESHEQGSKNNDSDSVSADYQISMMHCLREINVDNNMVGMYMSSYLGSYQTEALIETFLSYQESLSRCVCIIHDPTSVAERGVLSLKALRLSDAFVAFYKNNTFTTEQIHKAGLQLDSIFEEIPLHVHNSALVSALMSTLAPAPELMSNADSDRLNLDASAQLEKNVEFLIDNLDDLSREAAVINQWQRQNMRNNQARMAFLAKRRAENAARRAAGEEPLPEDDGPMGRGSGPEPTRLSAYLIANEMNTFCNGIHSLTSGTLKKLSLASYLHGPSAENK